MPEANYDAAGYIVGNTGKIVTYTGRTIEPLNPSSADVELEDIAHALSNQCRFTGHTKHFYSVAQHCVLVSELLGHKYGMWGLLHDASEAYLSDIAGPIKRQPSFGTYYKETETRLMAAICERFGLDAQEPPEVKQADIILLHTEQRDLMPGTFAEDPGEVLARPIAAWEPWLAKEKFLYRYAELTDPEVLRTQTKVFFKQKRTGSLHRLIKGG